MHQISTTCRESPPGQCPNNELETSARSFLFPRRSRAPLSGSSHLSTLALFSLPLRVVPYLKHESHISYIISIVCIEFDQYFAILIRRFENRTTPSVPEVPCSRENHGQIALVGGLDYLLIAHRTAGLNDRRNPGIGRDQEGVRKRYQPIGCHD